MAIYPPFYQSGAQRIHCVCQVLAMKNARVLIPCLHRWVVGDCISKSRAYFCGRLNMAILAQFLPIEELPDTIVPIYLYHLLFCRLVCRAECGQTEVCLQVRGGLSLCGQLGTERPH